MNTKNLIQHTLHSPVQFGSFVRELFQPLVNHFHFRHEEKREWINLKDEDLHFFENEDELEEYMMSFRE